MRVAPDTPMARRTMQLCSVPVGMKSISIISDLAVLNRVSRMSVPGRYRRVIFAFSTGSISQRPCSGVPSSAAKQAGESKRGRQSQSMEPSVPTSAAVRMLPITP